MVGGAADGRVEDGRVGGVVGEAQDNMEGAEDDRVGVAGGAEEGNMEEVEQDSMEGKVEGVGAMVGGTEGDGAEGDVGDVARRGSVGNTGSTMGRAMGSTLEGDKLVGSSMKFSNTLSSSFLEWSKVLHIIISVSWSPNSCNTS